MAEYEKTIAQMIGGCRDWSAQAHTVCVWWGKYNWSGDWVTRLRASSSKSRDQSSPTCGCTLKIPTKVFFTLPGFSVALSVYPARVIHDVGRSLSLSTGMYECFGFYLQKSIELKPLNPNLV